MATSDLERFFGYMQAFEIAWLSDDWSGLGDLFAADARYDAVDAGPFGGGGEGRKGVVAALCDSTRTIDRRFDVRIPEVIDGPRTRADGIYMRYRLTLRRAGLPDFVSIGDHVATFANGRIATLVDTPEPGTGARLAAYLAEHGARLRPAGSGLATDLDPRDVRDLEQATARSLVRAYGAAKSEQDAGAALAVCSPDFVLETPSMGAAARGREAVSAQLGLFFAVFPDYGFTIGGLAAEGDAVACWGTVRMTFGGRFLGLAPTGRTAELPAVSVFTCAGGAITGERFYLDLATSVRADRRAGRGHERRARPGPAWPRRRPRTCRGGWAMSAAMRRTVHRVCTLCEANCGLSFEVESNRILQVRPDHDDPLLARLRLSEGHRDRQGARRPGPPAPARQAQRARRVRADRLAGGARARGGGPGARPRGARRASGRDLLRQPDHPQPRRDHAALGGDARARHAQQLRRQLAGHEPALRDLVLPVRQLAGLAGAGPRPHAVPAVHRREPGGVERQRDDRARREGRACARSARAVAGSSSSTRAAPSPSARPTSTCRSVPAPTRACCSRWRRCWCARGSHRSTRIRAVGLAVGRGRAPAARRSTWTRARASAACRSRPSCASRASSRRRRAASRTRGSACATATSARSRPTRPTC